MSVTQPFLPRPRLALPAAVLLACLAFLIPGPADAENKPDKTFEDWATYVAAGNGESIAAMFCVDAKDRSSSLHMGKFQSKCGATRVTITFPLNAKADKDSERANISGELRVDQNSLHATNSRLWQSAGASYGHFSIDSFSNPQTLIDEMSTGQMIRFRFKVGEQEWYYRFPLKGFQPAFGRISQVCGQLGGSQERKPAKPASGEASKPRSGKKDSDYFPGTDSPSKKSDKDYF